MQIVPPVSVDLGGLSVRRLLPRRVRRMVGPWCFLDLMGPVQVRGRGVDVPPHPHTGLQTVTWLLEGSLLHKDSLDSEALAVPGALNLMTSGSGIAHSEETPRGEAGGLHGVQLWLATPDRDRHLPPSFEHHARRQEPVRGGKQVRRKGGAQASRLPDMVRRLSWLVFILVLIALAVALLAAFRVPQLLGTSLGEAIGNAGFAVRRVEIKGLNRMEMLPVYNVALDQQSMAMPLVDLDGTRRRLLEFGWVREARVSRRLPDTL